MKQQLLALALAATLAAPTTLAETMSFNGTTYNVTRTEKQLAQGVKYTHLIIDRGSSTYTEGSSVHIIEADLTDPTVSVKHGDSGRDSRRSLAAQAANLSSSTATVVAGANANFWCTTEIPYATKLKYEPFGASIKDGHMYSDPNCGTLAHVGGPTTTGMLAIDENGRCYIDYFKPQVGDNGVGSGWNFTITNNNPSHAHTFGLDQVNGVVCPGTAAMYSSIYGSSKAFRPVTSITDYSTATGTCTEILMDFASGTSAWNIGGETKLIIKEIRQNAGSGTLGNHDCAVVARDSYASVANSWAVGDEITITARVNFQSVGSPNRIMQATSGNCITMANGVIGYNSSQESYNGTNYARTLYGTNDDGSKLWIAVCEHYPNRQYTYLGFSTKAMTEILKIFGATWATQVDCGGSAQMYAGGSQVSTSTDSGGQRNVQSGVFILSSAGAAAPDTEKPTITRTTTMQNGSDSFYAYAYATDNVGVTKVQFPTWTDNNGQDDLVWHEGVKGNWTVNGQTYNYRYLINKSEHNNESGPYTIHVYAYDAAGNNSAVGMSFTFETAPPSGSLKLNLNYSDLQIAQLTGKTIKRVVPSLDGSHLYILAHDGSNAPTLLVYNHSTKTVKEELGTSNCVSGRVYAAGATTGDVMSLSDIDVADDGVLVGIGRSIVPINTTNQGVYLYRWTMGSDGIATGNSIQWNVSGAQGNYSNAECGESMAYYGTTSNGYVYYPAQTTGETKGIRWVRLQINSAGQIGGSLYNLSVSGDAASNFGSSFMTASPWSHNDFIVNSASINPNTITFAESIRGQATAAAAGSIIPTTARHTPIFDYNSHKYMIAATATGVAVADVTNGLTSATAVSVDATTLPSNTTTNVAAAGTAFNTSDMALFVVRDGMISKYSTVDETPAPVPSLKASTTEITLSGEQDATAPYVDVTITGENLASAINIACSNGSVTASKLDGWDDLTGGTLRITLNTENEAGNYTGYVAAQSGTNRVVINFTATISAPAVTPDPGEEIEITSLTEEWLYSTNKGNLGELSCFSVATPVTRDMCFADGKLYVLNATTNAASVAIVDAYTGKPTGASLNLNGISGGTYMLSGIKSLGNTVVGANFCDATGTLKMYKWNSDTAEPELWFSTTDHGSMEVGRSFNTSGDMTDGYISFGSTTGIVTYKVTNGTVSVTPTVIAAELAGNASNQSVYALSDGTVWVNNKDKNPLHIKADGSVQATINPDAKYKIYGTAIKAFTYGKRDYIAYTTTLGSTASAAWGNGAMILANVTDESSPVVIGSTCYPAAGLGETAWGSAGTNSVDYEITSDNSLNLWVMVPYQGIAMYQFKNTASGVEDIEEITAEEMPVEWYNLQGARVDGANLVPGIYIRRQGNDVKKVLVK